MKNLKTFSLVAAIAICALCLFDFNVTDGELWSEVIKEPASLSAMASFAITAILLTYFLLTIKEHGFGSWIGVVATGCGILGFMLKMSYLDDIDSTHLSSEKMESLENMRMAATMFLNIYFLVIIVAIGALASFAKTDAMKWVVGGLIVAYVLLSIQHILVEFFKPELSDYEHWDNAHEKYELAREAYKERCEMFHTIVGYLPDICWAIYFFYLAFKKDDAPQVEVAAVQGSVPKPATLVNPVAVSEPETVVPEQKSLPEQSAPEPPVSASGPVSEPPVPAPAPRKRRLWLWVTLIAAVVVGAVTYFMWPSDANGHEYVDLGLPSGLKWATCNVGASSPEEYGDYYAWGEVNTKNEYTEDNCSTDGKFIDNISGNPKYDAARAKWGGSWRMPTNEEFKELFDKCRWVWDREDGVSGLRGTGPNGNSIFFPTAGICDGADTLDMGGCYWTAIPDEDDKTCGKHINFRFGDCSLSSFRRYYGHSVRAVLD